MVLDMTKPKNKENTTWLGMRGRDAVRKSTPKVNIYRYSRSISQRSSLSWTTTRNRMDRTRVQRVGWTCKKDHTYKLIPEEKRRYKGQRYLTLNKEHGPMKLRSDFGAAVLMKNRLHHESGEQSVSTQINKDDGIHIQAHRGGTSLTGIGNELTRIV